MQNYKDLEKSIQRLDSLLIDSLLQRGYLSIQRNTSIIRDVFITDEVLEQAMLYIEIVSVIRRFCYMHPTDAFESPCFNTTVGGQMPTYEQVQSEITTVANTSVSALLRTFYTPNEKGILEYLKADLEAYGFPILDIQLSNCTSSSQSEQFEIKALLSLLKWITIINSYIPTVINLHQGKFREYSRGIFRRARSELEIHCESTKCELVLSGFRHFLVSSLHFKNSDVHMSEKYDLTNMYSHMQTISSDIRKLMLPYMWSNTTSTVVSKACQLAQVVQEDLVIDMKDYFTQRNFIRGLGVVIQDSTLVNEVQKVLDCYSHDFLIEKIKVIDLYSLPSGYWVYFEDPHEIHSSIELRCNCSRLMCIGQENSNLLTLETRGGEVTIVNDEKLKGDGSQRCLVKSKLKDIQQELDGLLGEDNYALLLTSSIDRIEGSILRFTPVSDNGNVALKLSYFNQ